MTANEKGAKLVSAEGQMIRELAELLNDTGLTEIEIEKSGLNSCCEEDFSQRCAASLSRRCGPDSVSGWQTDGACGG